MQFLLTFATIFSLASAAAIPSPPTTTTPDQPSRVAALTGITHTVVAGQGGLRFDPENVVAEVGDVVEWHFHPKNHSVAQSSFDKPCQPIDDKSFFAGFQFETAVNEATNSFQITVQDKKPIWFYCPQKTGSHCQKGMVGVVNQNFDSPDFTLTKHKALAAKVDVSENPEFPRGGWVLTNPRNAGATAIATCSCSSSNDEPKDGNKDEASKGGDGQTITTKSYAVKN